MMRFSLRSQRALVAIGLPVFTALASGATLLAVTQDPAEESPPGRMMDDSGVMGLGFGGDDMFSMSRQDEPQLTPAELDFFESRIRPALIEHCYSCHSSDAEQVRGDFLLDTREAIRRGGPEGPSVIPGNPDGSLLIQVVRHEHPFLEMPPKEKLPDDVIADLVKWVEMGAPDPRGVDEALVDWDPTELDIEEARQWWSFQQPIRHEPPTVRDTRWARTDIDRFLLAEMESRGLKPVRDADRDELCRRLTFDLTGLPPTPEEILAFRRDGSPQAVEKLVDRLLDSPHFGERWGRHWLDVARYAESSGKETNILYPHAWRYRDYVIDAFNKDKPYDRFVTEQLAGDLLPTSSDSERAEHLIATGYLAIGSKSHNARGRAQFAMDLADEQIDAMSQGVLGLTVACARCHDHKFDPIPTADYYAMAGIFLSSETMFGTQNAPNNRHTAELIPLPATSDVTSGPEMPDALHTAIERRLDEANTRRDELQEQINSEGMRDNNLRFQLRRANEQIALLEYLLTRFDDYGNPTDENRVAMGVQERAQPRDARILIRGEIDKPGDTIGRGFPEVLDTRTVPIISSGSGRLELAEWATARENPLTARVWVNRVWKHLMGHAIVPTPDNYGKNGLPPSHPELLDYLAVTFMEDDAWSTKSLIKRIVLSRAYQLGGFHNPRNAREDPDNIYYWRATPKRLEAEAIRDAMLSAAGILEMERPVGSPVNLLEGPIQAFALYQRNGYDAPVRSVYLPILRDAVPESLAVFDFAEPSFVMGDRDETNVPSQALYLLNDPTVERYAQAFADRLLRMDDTDTNRVEKAFLLALGRKPTVTEESAVRAFFKDFLPAQRFGGPEMNERNQQQVGMRRLAWRTFCQSLFASAEFRYLN